MRLGRLVPAAPYRVQRSGSKWSRSRKSLPAHGHQSRPCRRHVPREFTCDGANRPPRLQWSTPPSGTQELAVEMLDPGAPGGTFTHWLIYRMPPASPAWQPCRPAPRKASTTSAGVATGGHARRAAPRIITTSGPRAGHPAGPGSRSQAAASGLPHQRSRAGQGRTGRHLPACLSGPFQRQRARSGQQQPGPSPSPTFLAKLILRMFPQVRICGWRLIAYDLTARCPLCQVEGLV
jgi:hypothetical protein